MTELMCPLTYQMNKHSEFFSLKLNVYLQKTIICGEYNMSINLTLSEWVSH